MCQKIFARQHKCCQRCNSFVAQCRSAPLPSHYLQCHPWLGLLDVAVSSSELSELYHILIEHSGLIKPLLPFPSCFLLACGKGGGGHHGCQLVGDPLLEGIDQDVVSFDTATRLG